MHCPQPMLIYPTNNQQKVLKKNRNATIKKMTNYKIVPKETHH